MNVSEPGSNFDRARRWLLSLLVALSPHLSSAAVLSQPEVTYTASATFSASPATSDTTTPEDTGSEVDALQALDWCTSARHELETAQRLLEAMRTDSAPEVDRYLQGLATTLSQETGRDLDLHTLPALTDALRSARETLLNDASTYTRWVNLARAIQNDPEAWLTVPERFVVWADPAPEPAPLAEDDVSELRVRRAVRAFWGDDADSSSV